MPRWRGWHPAMSSSIAASSQGEPPVSSQAEAPTQLNGEDRYRRLDEGAGLGAVARGTFGNIYIAVDRSRGSTVVVKRQKMPSDVAARELAYYKALSQFPHPNVMPLLDYFTKSAVSITMLYMVFEVMGGDLWHVWKNLRRVLPLRLASLYLRHIVRGVSHLHGLGIVHADLSMANMLVGRQEGTGWEPCADILRIADFGGAASAQRMVLEPSEVITTEYCRAPEVFLGVAEVTPAIDMWAVGIVGVALLCGSTIFWRPTAFEPDLPGFEPRNENQDDWLSIFVNQALVLGPLTATRWPGCERLPAWSQVAGIMARTMPRYHSLGDALSDPGLVRRPIACHGAAAALLSSWLTWAPSDRMAAQESLGAAFFAESTVGPPAAMAALVKSLPADVLGSLVLESWWSGVPVTLEHLGQQAARDDSPRSVAQSQDVAEPDPGQPASSQAVSGKTASGQAGLRTADLAKRRRLTQKTDVLVPSAVATEPLAELPGILACKRETGFEPSSCQCKGNCGLKLCKNAAARYNRQKTKAKPICVRACSDGEVFCPWCKCESCPKGRQAVHGHGRWCIACGRNGDGGNTRKYHNGFGQWTFRPDWPEALRCTARSAFVTNLLPTEGTVKWEAFVHDFDKMRLLRSQPASSQGGEQPGAYHDGDVFFMCVVALVNLPSLLSQALSQLAVLGLDPRTASASDWRAYVVRMCHLVNGKPLADELKSISPGRAPASFGLITIGKRWEILRKVERGLEPLAGATVFSLGCLQQRYELLPAPFGVAKVAEAMDHVRRARLVFPMPPLGHSAGVGPASSQALATNLEDFVRMVQSLCLDICGQSAKGATGTLARRLLSIVELRCGLAVWDVCSMKTFSDVMPDMKQQATGLSEWTVREARRRFDMSALNISAMACLWGEVPSALRQKALKCSYLQICRAVEMAGNPHAQPKDWAAFLE